MHHFFSIHSAGHLIEAYGLWVVFAVIALESAGLPIPGETVLVAAALYAGSTHLIGIAAVVATAASATVLGGVLGYLIGRNFGRLALLKYGRYVRLTEARLKIGEYLFMRHGGKIVFFGRFIALLRAFVALLAGANQMPWHHFLVMNAFGGVCWASLFGLGAYLFGKEATRVAGPVTFLVVCVAAVLVIAGIVFVRRHESELHARAMAVLPEH